MTTRSAGWVVEDQTASAYAAMYDAPLGTAATAKYSNAEEFLVDVIGLAQKLGLDADAERLSARLAHIKRVFRSQVS